MARVKLKRKKIVIPSRYILLIIALVCVAMMLLTFFTDAVSAPLSGIASFTVLPFEKGFDALGERFTERMEELQKVRSLLSENAALKEQVDELSKQNSALTRDRYELSELRELYGLSEQLEDYDTVGARVIGKDPGNWFHVFLIDKGSEDGIAKDMNVVTGSGLVGLITEVGKNWASVRSIIDDSSNVSGMVLSTSDTLIVSGDLKRMASNEIIFEHLLDEDDAVAVGDQIVTSMISDKYLPGINIGFINSVDLDPNNLTKSGTLTPSVDFKHINVVLVIRELKAGKAREITAGESSEQTKK